ncbi:phosphoribosyltransferase family protein [Rhodanobacter ginsengiterrae]|uniref:phosphoribosyltransferase family protein n=1 Tax=Rhodanobacter ginsengiterrae TaxID=2008451 RepID=UPI003CED51DF
MTPWQAERFRDRNDAGRQLAQALAPLRGQHPLILAIPRGGVPIGRIVADQLDGQLDIVLVRKIGAPGYPEFAIGAVDESGAMLRSDGAHELEVDAEYLQREASGQLAVIQARRLGYGLGRPPIDPAGRTVVVVDDGLATGATMRAALLATRARKPLRLICAVPVASPRGLAGVKELVDDIVCLSAPGRFRAVGEFYAQFPAVDDSEVVQLLGGAPVDSPLPVLAESIRIPVGELRLAGTLQVPSAACGLVIFTHGSGSSRNSPRNRKVAQVMHAKGLATLLFDLLSEDEASEQAARFDIPVLTARLEAATRWAMRDPRTQGLPIGLFGASTGAAAALLLAARCPTEIRAVVSRGGRPDLAGRAGLAAVKAPTLLIVGGADTEVIALNRAALWLLSSDAELVVVPGATHLFEEEGALERVSTLATNWFLRCLPGSGRMAAGTR